MGRQQEVVLDLVQRLVDPETEIDVAALLDGLDSLETDLPLDELFTLMELARRADDAEVNELVIQPPLITFEGDRGDGRGYILEPDVEAIRAEVQETDRGVARVRRGRVRTRSRPRSGHHRRRRMIRHPRRPRPRRPRPRQPQRLPPRAPPR